MIGASSSQIRKGKAGETGRLAQGVAWVLPPQLRRGSADVPGREALRLLSCAELPQTAAAAEVGGHFLLREPRGEPR